VVAMNVRKHLRVRKRSKKKKKCRGHCNVKIVPAVGKLDLHPPSNTPAPRLMEVGVE